MCERHVNLVAGYREPRSVDELARFVELAVLDGLGMTMSRGREGAGWEFALDLDEPGEVAIVVTPFDDWFAMREAFGGRSRASGRFFLLSPEEARLIEARRARAASKGGV